MLFLASFNLQGGFSWIIHEDLHNYFYFSWHDLSEGRHSLFTAASHIHLNGRKTYCPQQAKLKMYQPQRKHIGKAVPFLCPAHCCCCTLLVLDTKSSQLYFHLGINHIVCGFFSPVVWEVNGDFADKLWAYFGEGKGTVCNECKNYLTTCGFYTPS